MRYGRERWIKDMQELQGLARVPATPASVLGAQWDTALVKPRVRFRNKDIAEANDQHYISIADYFVVNNFIGRNYGELVIQRAQLWDRTEFHPKDYGSISMALMAAKFARDEMHAADKLARVIIYAVAGSKNIPVVK